MAARSTDDDKVLGHVILLTGKEEFVSERTFRRVRERVHAIDAEAEFSDPDASELTLDRFGELTAPSLFASTRCVSVRALQDLPEESHDALVDYCQAPDESTALILIHPGGQKGMGLVTRLRKLATRKPGATVTEVKAEELKTSKMPDFVRSEVTSHGARIDGEAASFLVQAVGHDMRSLAAAADQLANDFPGEQLTVDKVQRYFGGRAEAKSFAVADAAFSGRRVAALEELRWALDTGTVPLLVTSAMAGSARGIARYLGAGRGARDADLARDLGVPPWKVRQVRDTSRAWNPDSIARAVRAVARADADIKGRASDASYTLERLVLTIAALRDER